MKSPATRLPGRVLRAYTSDGFAPVLPAAHRFPMAKYRRLRERVESSPLALAPGQSVQVSTAPAATREQLLLAHDQAYVDRALSGSLTAAELRTLGFLWSDALLERARRSVGATIAASEQAQVLGVGVNLAGGTHHAGPGRTGGYCLFNDVAVAAALLHDSGQIDRALVIDLDVHQGDGTAEIAQHWPWLYAFSMHGARNYPTRKVAGSRDIALADGTGDGEYLELLRRALPEMLAAASADMVFYLAGADPYRGDRLGRLNLSKAGLAARDAMVFAACRRHGLAICVCMAGGYAERVEDIVEIQYRTVVEALLCRRS